MASEARTRELADAALRVVSREGLSALSFRTLAAEAGCSLGAVQKAFASKEEILAAVVAEAQRKVAGSLSGEPGRPTLRAWLVELVLATLPLDADRRSASIIGVALSDRAPFDAELAQSLKNADDELRAKLALLAGRAIAEGELLANVRPQLFARAIVAFMAGLAGQLLYDPQPEEAVRALVESTIDGVLPPA